MKNSKQSKLVAILVLCVSVVGLTLGFAAFSNTLTISSNATVTPDASDFKMVIYGIGGDSWPEGGKYSDFSDAKFYTSDTVSIPDLNGNTTAVASATINNVDHTINMNVTFTDPFPDGGVLYYFMVKNEGKYDAYVSEADINNMLSNLGEAECSAGKDTSENLVAEACESSIDFAMLGLNSSGVGLADIDTFPEYIKVSPNDYIVFCFEIEYGGGVLPDGDMNVKFSDIPVRFSTTIGG